MKLLQRSQLAKATQVNAETLRYYEREALLPKPERTEAGYRLYTEADVKRVQFIKQAQSLGFSLKEIKELLTLKVDSSHSAQEVKQLTHLKIQQIEAKIQSLTAMKAVLIDLSKQCDGQGSVSDCPILKSIENIALNRKEVN